MHCRQLHCLLLMVWSSVLRGEEAWTTLAEQRAKVATAISLEYANSPTTPRRNDFVGSVECQPSEMWIEFNSTARGSPFDVAWAAGQDVFLYSSDGNDDCLPRTNVTKEGNSTIRLSYDKCHVIEHIMIPIVVAKQIDLTAEISNTTGNSTVSEFRNFTVACKHILHQSIRSDFGTIEDQSSNPLGGVGIMNPPEIESFFVSDLGQRTTVVQLNRNVLFRLRLKPDRAFTAFQVSRCHFSDSSDPRSSYADHYDFVSFGCPEPRSEIIIEQNMTTTDYSMEFRAFRFNSSYHVFVHCDLMLCVGTMQCERREDCWGPQPAQVRKKRAIDSTEPHLVSVKATLRVEDPVVPVWEKQAPSFWYLPAVLIVGVFGIFAFLAVIGFIYTKSGLPSNSVMPYCSGKYVVNPESIAVESSRFPRI